LPPCREFLAKAIGACALDEVEAFALAALCLLMCALGLGTSLPLGSLVRPSNSLVDAAPLARLDLANRGTGYS
jgi:hypothetical protein